MNKHQRILLFCAALLGANSVALAAFGAHALYAMLLANHHVETFGKAVDYAMYGALALLGIVVLDKVFNHRGLLLIGYVLALGTLLFSGTLFLYTMLGMKALTALTPVGGTLLIIAWLGLAGVVFFSTNKT